MKRATNSSSSTKRPRRVLIAMVWSKPDHMAGIARHLSDPDLSVKRIVEETGHSRTHLYTRFRKQVGMSVAILHEAGTPQCRQEAAPRDIKAD